MIRSADLSDATTTRQSARVLENGSSGFFREHVVILCLAAIAAALIVTRACIQSITIDEALSYLWFSARKYPFSQWYPHSANHVLNSLLMRLVTSIFGINELAVRTPALLGGIVYIASAVYLALLLTERKFLQWTLFACLVFNPFVLDYLIAARGYGLAIGFFLEAIAFIANAMVARDGYDDAAIRRAGKWASALLALSFSANFSFGLAKAVTISFFFAWAAMKQKASGVRRYARLAAACFAPGIAIAFVLSGSVLLDFPKGQLYFGSKSLKEMWGGITDASFEPLNRDVVNPLLLEWLEPLQSVLPWAFAFTVVLVLAANEFARWRRKVVPSGLLTFSRLLAGVIIGTVVVHWALHRTVRLLLPKDRTALFFVPLLILVLGAGVALRYRPAKKDITRTWAAGLLIAMALYFAGCLRLGYFKEWIFDADTRTLYWLAIDLHNRCGVTDFAVDWRYNVSMNFYREAYNNFSIAEFPQSSSDQLPPNKSVYVIYLPTSKEFIEQQKLKVIYHDDQSGSAVAIRGCSPTPQ